jgi:hypothetical protein
MAMGRRWANAFLVAMLVASGLGLTWAAATDEPARAAGEAEPDQELDRLRRQVAYLADALARARAEVDALKARADRKDFEEAGGQGTGAAAGARESTVADLWLVDVNPDLGMVVINAGRRQGLRPGMRFAVTRDGRKVTEVRVIEARPDICGAVIQSKGRGSLPRVKDRAVMITAPAE